MKDITGREIKVGDTITYASARGNAMLTVGKVVSVTENQVKVDRQFASNVIDGEYVRWEYDRASGTYNRPKTGKRAIPTVIALPNRCYVVS